MITRQPHDPRTSLRMENALSQAITVNKRPAGMVCRADEMLHDVVDVDHEALMFGWMWLDRRKREKEALASSSTQVSAAPLEAMSRPATKRLMIVLFFYFSMVLLPHDNALGILGKSKRRLAYTLSLQQDSESAWVGSWVRTSDCSI